MTSPGTQPHHRRLRSAGFTLVELAMVIGLIAALVALAVGGYRLNRERIDREKAVTDITYIALALQRYADDNRGYPPSLAEVGLDGMRDPWGEPYQYLPMSGARVGQVRKDKNLHPLNTDFDLYSKGPDRRSVSPLTAQPSRDDIVRANNGGFVGVASDY